MSVVSWMFWLLNDVVLKYLESVIIFEAFAYFSCVGSINYVWIVFSFFQTRILNVKTLAPRFVIVYFRNSSQLTLKLLVSEREKSSFSHVMQLNFHFGHVFALDFFRNQFFLRCLSPQILSTRIDMESARKVIKFLFWKAIQTCFFHMI